MATAVRGDVTWKDRLIDCIPHKEFLKSWRRFWSPFFACWVLISVLVLLFVQTTHLPYNTPKKVDPTLGKQIKDACNLYIANSVSSSPSTSATGSMGILQYSKGEWRVRIKATSTTDTSSAPMQAQFLSLNATATTTNSTGSTVAAAYSVNANYGAVNAGLKIALQATASLFANLTTGANVLGTHKKIVSACNEYASTKTGVFGFDMDIAQAPSVIQMMTVQVLLLSFVVATNQVMDALGYFKEPDKPVKRPVEKTLLERLTPQWDDLRPAGLNSSRSFATVILLLVWGIICWFIVVFSYAASVGMTEYDITGFWSPTYNAHLYAFVLLIVMLAFRFLLMQIDSGLASEKRAKDRPVQENCRIAAFYVFTNFTHVYIACGFAMMAVMFGMINMQSPCDKFVQLKDHTDGLKGFVHVTLNNNTQSDWVASSHALHQKLLDFTDTGTCEGMTATAAVCGIATLFGIIASILGPIVIACKCRGGPDEDPVQFARPAFAEAQTVSSNANTEMHPLTADTLNF